MRNFRRELLLNAAGEAGGAGAGAPGAAGTGAPAPGAAAPAPSDWTSGLNDTSKNYVTTKGFKDPGAVIDSYINLEKLMGAPKERLITLPETDDAEAWKPIYDRLGRPAKAEEYGGDLGEEVGGKEVSEFLKNQFLELGISKKQGEALIKKYGEHFDGQLQATKAEMSQKLVQEQDGLKKEWGAAFQQNINLASKAAHQFGLDAAKIDALEGALGYAGVMKFMHSLGAKVGESSFVAGNAGGGPTMLTPDMAKAQIETLKKDSAHGAKLLANDVATKSEWDRLHAMAYPTQNE